MFAYKWLPESKQPNAQVPVRKPVWHGVWSVLRNPTGAVQRLTLIYAVAMLAFSCLSSVLALYLSAEFGITEKTIGYVFLYVGVFSVLMRSALIGPIVDRIGEPWSIRCGAAILVLGLLAYPIAPTLWSLAFIVPLVPIGTSLLFPATTAMMSRYSPKGELGTTMGIAQTFAGISRVIAPVLSTTLFQRISHGTPFYFAATFVGLVSLLAFQVEGRPVARACPCGRLIRIEVNKTVSSLPNFVFHKGRVVPYSEVKFGVLMHAMNYGTAVFGGLRAYWNEDEKQLFVFRPHDHFRRFLQSSKLLCMNLGTSGDDLAKGLMELIQTEGHKEDLYIRPLAFYSDEIIGVRVHDLTADMTIVVMPFGSYNKNEDNMHVTVSSWRRIDDNSIPARGKIAGRLRQFRIHQNRRCARGFRRSDRAQRRRPRFGRLRCELLHAAQRRYVHASDHGQRSGRNYAADRHSTAS